MPQGKFRFHLQPMDPSDFRPSPRRELQGPRPSRLSINRDSHKIKKPPLAPPHHHHHHTAEPLPPAEQQHRDPVVIYSVSPKIIHANASEFMTLVQRLTGPGPSVKPPPPSPGGALSPAARIASFEKGAASPDGGRARAAIADRLEIDGGGPALDWPAPNPGILSPVPAALPPISPNLFTPNLFSPSFDLSFLFELSPAVGSMNGGSSSNSKGFLDGGSLWASPSSNLLLTPMIPSPGACWDILSQLPDV